jgi:hypothetical protein
MINCSKIIIRLSSSSWGHIHSSKAPKIYLIQKLSYVIHTVPRSHLSLRITKFLDDGQSPKT